MAQHGYLREYDEGWDRGDDRERGEREWRERGERDWRGSERDHDRGRGFMFDDRDRERDRYRGRDDEDRGFFSRMGDEARSWFSDDDDRRSDRGAWEKNRDWPQRSRGMGNEGRVPYGQSSYSRERGFTGQQGGFGGSNEWRENRSSFSSHPDDHYRSWRDRQIQSLDRDYQDYCREREQQFHSDFDSWRQNRQQSQGGAGQQPPGSGQQQQSGGASDQVMELNNLSTEGGEAQGAGTSPTGAATLGTNNSENSTTGRGRR
jgi:hypothetical protein